MKKINIIKIATVFAVLLTLTACSPKPVGNENENPDNEPTLISVDKIQEYEGIEITDWYDDETVVLAKDNLELEKMSLLENSEFYPRSIYLYDLDTKQYKTLKAQKNIFLGEGTLSPDKKHLLYDGYSIGDTSHYLMSMDESKESTMKEDVIGIAITAEWADANTVIGVSYAGGAYMADTSRNLTQIVELQDEQLFTVEKILDKIYYTTIDDPLQLYMLDLTTKEKKKLKIENVNEITPSPDGKQILISQGTGNTRSLLVADNEGNILETIAEGIEISGASWSPDQLMIAYRLKSVINGVSSSGLYIYDILNEKSMEVAEDIGDVNIKWSPSGKKISFNELDERNYNSSIIYLK